MKNINKKLISLGLSLLTTAFVAFGAVPDFFAPQQSLPSEADKTTGQQAPNITTRQIFDESPIG